MAVAVDPLIFADSQSPLFEYFAIIGYNPTCGLRQEKITEFTGTNTTRKSPLETAYEAKVIIHYPNQRPDGQFTPEIAKLALPSGLHLYTEQNLPNEPSFHSFVVVREDGTRIYGCSLTFYEQLQSIDLRQQIFDAQLTYLHEFASSTSAYFLNSNALPSDSNELSKESARYTSHSLPRKLSASKGSTNYLLNKKLSTNEEHIAYYKNPKSPLFITKCIAVTTTIPVIYSSENFLHNLWMLFNDKFPNNRLTCEQILHWALHEIFLPPPNSTLRITHTYFQMLVRRPAHDELPFFDYPIEMLFGHISVDKFLKLLTSFMLEKQVLLISKNARTLMLIAECLSTLIFPFSWQMTYCPILPHSEFKFLEAPVPWLMGLCLENETLPEDIAQSNICFLDMDSGRFEIPEDLPTFPRSQLITAQIQTLLREFKDHVEVGTTEHSFYQRGLQFNNSIRSIFLGHFVDLFSTYKNYLLNIANDDVKRNCNQRRDARILRESTANFDKISFLVDQPESVLPFLSAFLETQIFTSFIDSKIFSQSQSPQSNYVYIFDQKILLSTKDLNKLKTISNHYDTAVNSSVTPKENETEFHISLPTPQNSVNIKYQYNGIMPIPDPNLLESLSKIPENRNKFKKLEQKKGNSDLDKESKHILIMQKNESQNDDIVDERYDNSNTSAPMNLAHHNWKFVEQLLKETKAKTKRILVAKMGKEAIHLGHGQLHMGISGVEENTMVAAFCDLLERIWSHGLKKKQGKSALWAYIIAFHEWERKNRSTCHRSRSNSTKRESVLSESPTGANDNDSPFLIELIGSFRKIADTLDFSYSHDDAPSKSDFDGKKSIIDNSNWSHSLLKAANTICERITATANLPSSPTTDIEYAKRKNCENKFKTNCRIGLPPRPPTLSHPEKQQRLFTPQIKRRVPEDERTIIKTQTQLELDENGGDERNNEKQIVGTYRKFIYQEPLKAVNNKIILDKERKSRDREINKSSRTQRSWSSQPQNDLASRYSEDSLSKINLLSKTNDPNTPIKRRTRDSSSDIQYTTSYDRSRTGRSLSRSRAGSPSRLYERWTRGVMTPEFRTLPPLPNTMVYDLKNIIRMTEIKTDIGFARAFVRLALERKLLYHYLKKLLSNSQLLQKFYKRYSFLRCDDEREQFLFHLLSLNAVDFSCFTNTFLTIKMRYQVMLAGSLDRFSDSLIYIVLTGSQGCTSSIFLPANSKQFTFEFKNLGILSTLRIGHSSKEHSTQRLTKWYLNYVLVQNCITAQTFYFHCARWFGRGVEDGALERLLVAEAIVSHPSEQAEENTIDESNATSDNSFRRAESPINATSAFLSPRKSKYNMNTLTGSGQRKWRSPSSERKMSDYELQTCGKSVVEGETALDSIQSLEHRAGVAVNALMKYFLSSAEKDRQGVCAKLSTLLCAEDGLLPCIDEIFSHGLLQRIFQKFYPWDYVVKVFAWFNQFFRNGESKKLTREQRSLIIYAYKMVEKIGEHNAVGKEGKFHLFVLLSLRDHIFSGLIPLVAWTPITKQLYDQNAFIRLPSKLSYFVKLIGSLNEFHFEYEKSLTHDIIF